MTLLSISIWLNLLMFSGPGLGALNRLYPSSQATGLFSSDLRIVRRVILRQIRWRSAQRLTKECFDIYYTVRLWARPCQRYYYHPQSILTQACGANEMVASALFEDHVRIGEEWRTDWRPRAIPTDQYRLAPICICNHVNYLLLFNISRAPTVPVYLANDLGLRKSVLRSIHWNREA